MLKKITLLLALSLNLISYILNSSAVYAQTTPWTNRCVSQGDVATIQGLECLFANILRVIMYLAGLAFFFMFIINGFNYIFSGSDQKKLAQINTSLTLSVVGLIGVIASWLIVKFIRDFTGIDVVNFQIPGP